MGVSECRLISLIPLSFEPIQVNLSLHGYLISENLAWRAQPGSVVMIKWVSYPFVLLKWICISPQPKFLLDGERSHMQLQRSIREGEAGPGSALDWRSSMLQRKRSASFLGQEQMRQRWVLGVYLPQTPQTQTSKWRKSQNFMDMSWNDKKRKKQWLSNVFLSSVGAKYFILQDTVAFDCKLKRKVTEMSQIWW